MMSDHTAIWDQVEKTDPSFTKQYKGAGGFSGTSINPVYLVKKATQVFGPMGIGWGIDVDQEDFLEGHILNAETGERKIVHRLKVTLWYILPDKTRGSVTNYGITTFVGQNKFGLFTDDEAPKKSLTDATNKCLSRLGFGGDIFMGMYDDREYRQGVEEETAIAKADDQDAERAKIAEEYSTWRDDTYKLVETAASTNELQILCKAAVRKMGRRNDAAGLRKIEKLQAISTERLNPAPAEPAQDEKAPAKRKPAAKKPITDVPPTDMFEGEQ